jgi:putative transposase
VKRLEGVLAQGALAAGYDDERWTLARVAALIRTLFHRTLSRQTVSVLLRRMDFTPQIPAHRARERDEAAIVHWRRYQWPTSQASR